MPDEKYISPECVSMLTDLTVRTVGEVCVIADKYGYDRDDILDRFCNVLVAMSEISTIAKYKIES